MLMYRKELRKEYIRGIYNHLYKLTPSEYKLSCSPEMGLLRQYNFPNRFSELKGLRGLKMVNNEIPWSMKLQMLMTFSNSK